MPEIQVVVNHPQGLHARPASLFVQTANRYGCEIRVTHNERTVDAKSILGILTLGVRAGGAIQICAQGLDAEQALRDLNALVQGELS